MRPINEMIDELVANIRRICKEKNISISQMEADLGFSPGLISRWNKTKTSPSFDKIVAIMNYLNVTFDELMFGVTSDEDTNTAPHYRNVEIEVCEKLLKDSESGRMKWAELDEDGPFQISNNDIFPDLLSYRFHVIYYTSFGKGYFFLALQYHDKKQDTNLKLYKLSEEGYDPVQMKVSKVYANKLLKYADYELYMDIAQKKEEKMMNDYLEF